MKIFIFFKTNEKNQTFRIYVYIVTTNGLTLSHNKSLQIYVFCVKRKAKNDFPKDVERTVGD